MTYEDELKFRELYKRLKDLEDRLNSLEVVDDQTRSDLTDLWDPI